jgi:hypothetical protein
LAKHKTLKTQCFDFRTAGKKAMLREIFPCALFFHSQNIAKKIAQATLMFFDPIHNAEKYRVSPIKNNLYLLEEVDYPAAACYVLRLRWAHFTHSVPGRQWGRSTQYGPEENCHPGRAPA